MAINVCEDHEDAICVWIYGRECPFCNVVKQVESLKEKLEESQDQTANAEDRLREVQAELTEANERIAE
jgi:predicted nuclease with TOPRIM domain